MIRFWLLLALCVFGCRKSGEHLSIPRARFVPILVDIHIARSAVQNASPATRDSLYEMYFGEICALHQVAVDSVRHDLQILTRDPDRMEVYYKEVVEILDSLVVGGRLED